LIFPDTVFFNRGRAVSIVKCDKDFCLTAVKNQSKNKGQGESKNNKLSLQFLTSMLNTVYRNRKNETNSVFNQIYNKHF